jgi:FxsC-like protein
VPAIPGLAGRRDAQRALRPLRRRVPSHRRRVLDEDATAAFIAGTGVWSPVERPARERWFDVALAVDTAPSMALWWPLAADLRTTLVETGAFRDVRLWHLETGRSGCAVRAAPDTARRRPRELVDASGRRLFLVLTDGAARSWHDGSAVVTLADWGRTGPVAVLQPLPEGMWSRTGLPAIPAVLSTGAAGQPNARLRADFRRRAGRLGGTPIPVLGVEPTALRSWARLLAGAATGVPLAVTTPALGGLALPLGDPDGGSDPLARFRAGASPGAYRLAVCLSMVPLTLPIMRLVQHVAVPGAGMSALAEVVLGGLVLRTGADSYEFAPNVRDALLGEVRRSEAGAVFAAVSRYVEQHAAATDRTFPAVAHADRGPAAAAGAFAWVTPVVAARLGVPAGVTAARVSPPPAPPPAPPAVPPAVTGQAPPAASLGRVHRHYFFLSYARGDDSDSVQRFYSDLSREVRERVGLPRGTEVGFLDTHGIETGVTSSAGLVESLATCGTFVALVSPRYLRSETCGREWSVFANRMARHTAYGQDPPTALLPLLWLPPPALPPVVEELQYSSYLLPPAYADKGLRQLIRLDRYRDQYHEFVDGLARQIIRTVESEQVPPAYPSLDLHLMPSAFHAEVPSRAPGSAPAGTPPTVQAVVRFVVAAPTQSDLASAALAPMRREPRFYGPSAVDWRPYAPDLSVPVAELARDIAEEHQFTASVTDVSNLPAVMAEAGAGNQLVILLIDPWVTHLEEAGRVLSRYDRPAAGAEHPLVAVMVPASAADPHTQAWHDELIRWLHNLVGNLLHSLDGVMCRTSILSHRAFDADLRVVLERVRNEAFRTATPYHRPAGRSETPPVIRGP